MAQVLSELGFFVTLSVMIVARYFVVTGSFYPALCRAGGSIFPARRLMATRPSKKLMLSEIGWSLIASLIYVLLNAIVIMAW